MHTGTFTSGHGRGTLSLNGFIHWWQGTMLSCILWQFFLFHSCKIALDGLMLCEVSLEAVLIQIRLQSEDLLGNFLIFSLDSFQLSFTLIEV